MDELKCIFTTSVYKHVYVCSSHRVFQKLGIFLLELQRETIFSMNQKNINNTVFSFWLYLRLENRRERNAQDYSICFSKCKEISYLSLHFIYTEICTGFYKDLLFSTLLVIVNVTPVETRKKLCSIKQVTLKAFDCIVQCCVTEQPYTDTQ